jgi:hypothetical protein
MRYDWAEVTELVGKTLTSINVENGKDEIISKRPTEKRIICGICKTAAKT